MKDSVKLPNGKILIKKNRIEENSSTRVKSALFNRGNKIRTFAILTAENPLGERQSPEKNNEDMRSLKKELKTLHLNYIKVLGMYGNKEHSVMIVNLSYDDAENLAGMFLQDSFIFGDDNGIRYYKIDVMIIEKKYPVYDKIINHSDWKLVFENNLSGVFVPINNVKEKYIYPSIEDEYYNKTKFNTDIKYKRRDF